MSSTALAFEGALGELPATVHKITPLLKPGSFLFLEGDLGAGKTSFVKLLAAEFGFAQSVTSPTFSLMNVYLLPQIKHGILRILHLDLYRVRNGKELCLMGLEREFDGTTLCVIEWGSKIEDDQWDYFFDLTGCLVPTQKMKLEIEIQSSARRTYTFGSV
jgi:tRNA threonylcarbamoyladenosine biosynthesis protein TsaE